MRQGLGPVGSYLLRTHAHFCASHQLHGYEGDCVRLHGHNYRVEVEVEASELDEIGLGMDFREIRAAAETVAGELDHRHLNELEPFEGVNPSAEHIAAHFYRRLSRMLDRPAVRVRAVTIHETERCSVRYEPSGSLDSPSTSSSGGAASA